MKIAGLDIGTTGCKCTVFDIDGRELGKSYRDYPVSRKTFEHEIDTTAIMDSVYTVLREMAAEFADIAGIGVTSFGETFVCLDENGVPLANAMLYTDPRGSKECRYLVDKLGGDKIARITGVAPHEMYGLPKFLWIKNNKPDVYAKTKHILQMEDYVIFSLTGERVIDYSLATRFMAFDIQRLEWNDEILEAAGVDKNLLSKPVSSGSVAGCITSEAAKKTGLSEGVKIVAISQDQMAAAIGAGALSSEIGVDGAGTVQCLTTIYDGIPDINKLMPGKYVIVPYAIPGKFVTYAFSYTGGALIKWCTDNIAKTESEQARKEGVSVYSYLEEQYCKARTSEGLDPQGPSGLLVLPHFAGAATPYMDTGSKGVIVGLTTATTPADIYRACMEGVCYEMYLNYTNILGAGAAPKKLHATGGGAKSAVWMQMKADVLNIPIVALKTVDAGTVGSAMLTGIALGVFKDIDDAAYKMVEEVVTYTPRKNYHEQYMQVYQRYAKLYDAVRELM